MRPITLVKQVINQTFPDFEVYEDSIDEDDIDDVQSTQVLLTESDMDNTHHGDGTFNSLSVGVDIQIFYGEDFDKDMTVSEIQLMKEFEHQGWTIVDSQPHYLDISQTDVQQTIKNLTINKIMTLEEIGYTG